MSTASPPFFPGIASLALIAVFASACGDEGPLMRPGENCLSCHNRGGTSFTVAGTVFPSATAGRVREQLTHHYFA